MSSNYLVQNTYFWNAFCLKVIWLRTVLHEVVHSYSWCHSQQLRRLLTLDPALPDRDESWLSSGVQQGRSVLLISELEFSLAWRKCILTSTSDSEYFSPLSWSFISWSLVRSGWDLTKSLLALLSSSSLLLVSASSAWILSRTLPGVWRVTEDPTGGETFGTDWNYWN